MGIRRTVLAVIVAMLTLAACGTIPDDASLQPGESTAESAAASPDGTPAAGGSASPAAASPGTEQCDYEPSGDAAKSVRPPSPTGVATSGTIDYDLEMTEGTVRITLDPARAPCTVHSFQSLAEQGYFDAVKCHRLVDSGLFLFQCGDPTGSGRGGPGYTFADELDGTETYTKGMIAMANAGPNTNGSQFFLVYRDSTSLDRAPNYTIFGTVETSGIGILERMAAEGQDGTNSAGGGVPNNPSEILKVTKVG